MIIKIRKILIIFMYICIIPCIVLADDLEEETALTNAEIQASSKIENNDAEILKNINSRAYIVLDRNSNKILCGKNQFEKRKMASTTKIMTATVIIENCKLSETIEISKKATNIGGSTLGLKTGDKITIRDLLYGLMLRSGNDCAIALAEYAGGSIEGFAELMNRKACELGLENTHFETPHGLDSENHYTTAYELALLSNYAMNNKTFANIVGTVNYTISINGYKKNINNTNELLGNLNGVYGIKTGFTNGANRCLVTCCKRNNMDIICVVLGADTKSYRTKDSIKLIEYVFKNFEPVNVEEKMKEEFIKWRSKNKFFVVKGKSNNIQLEMSKTKYSTIPIKKEQISDIKIQIECENKIYAPIKENTNIGNVFLKINDEIISESNIIVINSIEKRSITDYLMIFLKNYNYYFENMYNNGIYKYIS